MTKKSTPWPEMIRAVYASLDTGRHSGDATTRRVMDRVVSWLAARLELSPRLQDALIQNINQRTHYKMVDPGTPIKLTRDQVLYARKTNPEWFGLGLAGHDIESHSDQGSSDVGMMSEWSSFIPTPFLLHSDVITTSFRLLSYAFPTEAVELAEEMLKKAKETAALAACGLLIPRPKEEKSREDESNHESMEFASQIDVHEVAITPLPQVVIPPLPAHVISGHHDRVEHPPIDLEETHGQENVAPTFAPALTVWVKPGKRGKRTLPDLEATGNLDIDGQTFRLRFTAFDHAVSRIPLDEENADWLRWIGTDVGAEVRSVERTRSGLAARSTASALYAKSDWSALKRPSVPNVVVILDWHDGKPCGASIIADGEIQDVRLTGETNERYKGSIA